MLQNSYADSSLLTWEMKAETHFQFERLGFFVVDKDSNRNNNSKYVFNLTGMYGYR